MNIVVLSGQGGWVTSPGIMTLANELRPFGEVESFLWDSSMAPAVVAEHVRKLHTVVVIGYSLGANQLGWIDNYLDTVRVDKVLKIALGIAIDPSQLSPLCQRNAEGIAVQHVKRYQRLLSFYHRNAMWFGGAKFEGDGVEVIPIRGTHLAFQFDRSIRARTIAEVEQLAVVS